MTRSSCCVLFVAALCCGPSASAVTIETVPVGNRGNAGDVQSQGTFGAVPYAYRIGKYEVTNAQYVEFLNGVDPTGANTLALYNGQMSSDARGGINFSGGAAGGSKYEIKADRDDNPVVFVSWYDSIRFANWLHNGQGSGDTENGVYTIEGGTATPSNGNSITRDAGARWFLPSEDEWYKAAYHKNDGATGNYWDYPISTDADPFSDQPPGSGAPTQSNTANFVRDDRVANGYNDGHAVTGSPSFDSLTQNYLTDVGAYTLSTSPYGTFDHGGNVWEWNEELISAFSAAFAAVRGSTTPSACLRRTGSAATRRSRTSTLVFASQVSPSQAHCCWPSAASRSFAALVATGGPPVVDAAPDELFPQAGRRSLRCQAAR